MSSTLETAFLYYLHALAPECPLPLAEYRFAIPRRWRFDFCWCDAKLAIELEGGTRSNGRHNRAAGYAADCEKYNAAMMAGWRVLRFTGDMLHSDPGKCIEMVLELLKG